MFFEDTCINKEKQVVVTDILGIRGGTKFNC
jgi:hypothetical protein